VALRTLLQHPQCRTRSNGVLMALLLAFCALVSFVVALIVGPHDIGSPWLWQFLGLAFFAAYFVYIELKTRPLR
jgi:uncharacterized membrane protein